MKMIKLPLASARLFTLGAIILVSVLELSAATPLQMAQQAYLKAFNTGELDQFGTSVAISGDTVVVGALYESSNATGVNDLANSGNDLAYGSGAAYVFVRNGTNWTQQAYLKASNPEADDGFGSSVAISGDTIVVGAPYEDGDASGDQNDNSAEDSGAAYVFVRNGNTWTQQAFLKASNADTDDSFARSVSVSGDTIVIGAALESSNATGVNGDQNDNSAFFAGAAYVFARAGTAWTQQAYLKASNAEAGDGFGVSVSVSSNTVVVGASGESSNGINYDQNNNNATFAGAVYVFARDGTDWFQRAYLKASSVDANDGFGQSVSVSGDTLVVGATGESSNFSGVQNTGERTAEQDNNSAFGSGAAYVFVSDSEGFEWTQQAYLKASNTGSGDGFGRAVAISGDAVVIGAYFESSSATGINHPTGQGNNAAYGSGAAYVFVRTGLNWSQQAYVKASNTGAGNHPSDVGDYFGFSVGISGDTMVAGAPREDSGSVLVNGNQSLNNALQAGAAYVFSGFAPPDGPEIAVEDSLGVDLRDGTAMIALGVVPVGSNQDFTFIVRNVGNDELTSLSITIDGDNTSDFSVIAVPAPSVASGGGTSFTVRFAPGAVGFRSARLHLVSNDSNESPFDIALTSVPAAPTYRIDTIAGTGAFGFSGDDGPAIIALLSGPRGVALDNAGNIYIGDRNNERVRRVGSDGIITTFAGTGVNGFSGDSGPATQAQLAVPRGVAVDGLGNVYIADLGNFRVRRVDTNGIITTFAGTGVNAFSGDGGPATQASVGFPTGLFVDGAGNVYITDISQDVVRRVDTNGIITTVAGTGVGGFNGDGVLATQAQLNRPSAVVVDSNGNVLIADEGNYRVRRVGTNGIITTIAGTGGNRFRGDGGPALEAQLNPSGLAVDSAGNVFIAANERIRRVDTSGVIATIAGDGRYSGAEDGTGVLSSPVGTVESLAMDGAGNIFFAADNRMRRISPLGGTFPLQPVFASTPAPGTIRFPDFDVGATEPSEVTLFIGNAGTADLRIDSIGFTDTNVQMSINGSASFPHFIPSGTPAPADPHRPIQLTFRWQPIESGVLETTLRIVSNDPATPVAIYTLSGIALAPLAQAGENVLADWIVSLIGGGNGGGALADRSKAVRKLLTLNGTQTAVLTINPNTSPTLTAEVPAFLGGGSVQLSNFTGSTTVSLLPIPNDFERASIRVDGGSMTAPSVQLPSGLDTGLNQLTFGPPEQSGGVLFLTNGSYTAYATARIVNDLIPDGVTVRGKYSGIYNPETGEVSSQSQSTDLFEPSDRVLFSYSTNGLWLTWANTNALQEATDILGPWRPVTNAISPYTAVTTNHPQQFFRLHAPVP